MIWLAVFFICNCLFLAAYRASVPSAHRAKYLANQKNSRACHIAAALIYTISGLAFVQWLSGQANHCPWWLRCAGVAGTLSGSALVIWACAVNPYLIPQLERPEQIVVDGPYSFFRHPMFLGASLRQIGNVCILGQWWAVLPLTLYLCLLIYRGYRESKLLYG